MAIRSTIRVLTALVMIVAAPSSHAGEIFNIFESLRSKTMGGAHLVTADDELAIYTNPAGISRVRNPRGSFDTNYEISSSVIGPLGTVIGGITDSSVEKNPLNAVSNAWGKYHYFSFAATPHFVAQNFSIQLLWRHQTGFFQQDATTLEMHRQIDLGLVAGVGFPLFGGVLKVGASGKILHRAEANTVTNNGSTYSTYDFENNTAEGIGFGANAGVTLTAPIRFFPAISGVIRNIGGMSFGTHYSLWSDSSGTRAPPADEPQAYDVGYGMTFRIGRDSWVNVGADLRDIKGYLSDMDTASTMNALFRHFHAGLEISLDRTLYIRLGAYQGYPSVGLGIITRIFALEAGMYGIETGTLADRRVSYRGIFRLEFGY